MREIFYLKISDICHLLAAKGGAKTAELMKFSENLGLVVAFGLNSSLTSFAPQTAGQIPSGPFLLASKF